MTEFEQFADEIGVKITTDSNGLYTGMCKALADIATEIILSDDNDIFSLEWEKQKEIIKEYFYRLFPYMA